MLSESYTQSSERSRAASTYAKTCFFCPTTAILLFFASLAYAQEINLLPKYGALPKTDGQKAADAVFISGMDHDYHGDRKKAANDMAMRGWQYLMQGDPEDAMRRFNQAWLLDANNGTALWGMAAIQADKGKLDDAISLLAEAQPSVGHNLNFSVDYARVVALAGVNKKDQVLLNDSFARFERIYQEAPQNGRNLKNWAITLYSVGNYSDAWAKVKLAEATPNKGGLDPHFISELESQMPRPAN